MMRFSAAILAFIGISNAAILVNETKVLG